MIRVAFTLAGSMRSTGGYNYLINLLRAVDSHEADRISVTLLSGTDTAEDRLKPFQALASCAVVRTPLLDESNQGRLLVHGLLLGRVAALNRLFDAQGIDLVFEAATFFGWRGARPTLAWIPDLQHRVLPHMFSRPAWWRREIGFRAQIAAGRCFMVSSEDSHRACLRYYPATGGRVRAVRFAVPAPPPVDASQSRAVADRYGLPASFFFMPNQYWQHKNHLLVIRALAMLRQQGRHLTVFAPGNPQDPRNPAHVPAVRAAVRDSGLGDRFLMPGLIPYEDLQPLMQASTALVNPSLFEGWSTSVEEARSAGVPMLLSDLDVHREQAGTQAIYFDRHSAQSLAAALSTYEPPGAVDRDAMRHAAAEDAQIRIRRFAADFAAAAAEATGLRTHS